MTFPTAGVQRRVCLPSTEPKEPSGSAPQSSRPLLPAFRNSSSPSSPMSMNTFMSGPGLAPPRGLSTSMPSHSRYSGIWEVTSRRCGPAPGRRSWLTHALSTSAMRSPAAFSPSPEPPVGAMTVSTSASRSRVTKSSGSKSKVTFARRRACTQPYTSSVCWPPVIQSQSFSSTATLAPSFQLWMSSKHRFITVDQSRFFSQYVLPYSQQGSRFEPSHHSFQERCSSASERRFRAPAQKRSKAWKSAG